MRIDEGSALFYGESAGGIELYVHVKQGEENELIVEIKSKSEVLAKSLVREVKEWFKLQE